jgi:hypothetical protein
MRRQCLRCRRVEAENSRSHSCLSNPNAVAVHEKRHHQYYTQTLADHFEIEVMMMIPGLSSEALAALLRTVSPAPLVVATLAACYGGALPGPFQFDDYGIVNDAATHSLSAWLGLLGQGLRSLLELSYMLSRQIDAGTAGFHVVNVVIHTLNTLLVLLLARTPLDPHGRRDAASAVASVVCALLFAVHPCGR